MNLRLQVRALQRREHGLLFLLNKVCTANRAEAEVELVRVRKHFQAAEERLEAYLRDHPGSQRTIDEANGAQ